MRPARSRPVALAPDLGEDGGEEDMLPRSDRVSLDADKAEKASHSGADPLHQQLLVADDLHRRGGEGLEDGDRGSGAAARGVDGQVDGIAQALDARSVLAPAGQAVPPGIGLLGGIVLLGEALLQGVLRVHPGKEVLLAQLRERQHEVAHVPLGVDDDGGYAVQGGLLQQRDAQPGLAATGHAHAHGMGHHVLGVVKEEVLLHCFAGKVILAP